MSSPTDAVVDRAGLLAQMTIAEKADLITGQGVWTTRPVDRLGVPSLVVTDGPNGARGGGLLGTGTPTACIPAGSVLGATWDVELLQEVGKLLGEESLAKSANVLLAPTINLHRHSLGGRNFECYSEDPLLSGELAAAYIQGVQSCGVATTPKHLVGNDSEFERNFIDVQIDERTLREVYLLPFEFALRKGGAWGLMSAYNRLNGSFCSENEWLLKTVLRENWGFDGFVVSDWFAVRSTAESIVAGTSLEMPGPGKWFGPARVAAAIEAGEMDEAHLDEMAADMLLALERTGAFEGRGGGPEKELDRVADRELVKRAAIEGAVLLRNDGVLPLQLDDHQTIAVIGPNARSAKIMGGGSANVRAYHRTSPLDAMQRRFPNPLTWAQGSDINRSVEALGAPQLAGMHAEYFDGREFAGEVKATADLPGATMVAFGAPMTGVQSSGWSMRATGTLVPEASGSHTFSMVQAGRGRVLLDGEVIIDAMDGDFGRGDDFFGMGSAEIELPMDLEAGREYTVTLEYIDQDVVLLAGMRLGLVSQVERDLMGEAVALAAEADVAIVVVGTNDDWETEGRDRDLFVLPGDQPDLIRNVAAVNPRTIVVVNAGGPHGLDWLDVPAAVLNMGFAGQEMGDALVDILTGTEPGGRLPFTVPADYAHSPALPNYPGENSVVRYGEGLLIGHRWFDTRRIAPAAAFGEGMSYASFDWSEPRLSGSGHQWVVEVDVTNTSDRDGIEVVQAYVEPPEVTALTRPARELKGFAKLHLGAGETATATIELGPRAFAYYDPSDQVWDDLQSDSPVPAGEGASHRTAAGWYIDGGDHHVVLARSIRDHVSRVAVAVAASGAPLADTSL